VVGGHAGARGIPEDDIEVNFKAIRNLITARLGDDGRPAVSLLDRGNAEARSSS
jgi:hypothetical protein